jgi:hypothetical protein
MEVNEMNNDDRVNDDESETTSNVPPTDTSDKPVDGVEGALEDNDAEDLEHIRKQELRRKVDEIERKVADGN